MFCKRWNRKKVVVKSGIQDLNYIEVLSGINSGDEVVVGPYSAISKNLKDGMKVNVVPKDKLFEKNKELLCISYYITL